MSVEFNQFNVTGNLGRDAEVRYTPDGRPVASFSLCNNRTVNGEKRQLWIRCSWFGTTAEKVAEYLLKGTGVLVSGPIELREYQANDGTTKNSLELIVNNLQLLGGGPRSDEDTGEPVTTIKAARPAAKTAAGAPKATAKKTQQATFDFSDDEEVPF